MCSSLDFLNPSRLATQLTDVVELGAADASGADNLDLIDDLRVKRKNSLDTMPEGNLAHREGRPSTTMFHCNTNAFEHLDALFVAFLDLDVNFDGIARLEAGYVRAELLFLNHIECVHKTSIRSQNANFEFSVFDHPFHL